MYVVLALGAMRGNIMRTVLCVAACATILLPLVYTGSAAQRRVTSKTWTYDEKLTPWTWTDHYGTYQYTAEPEVPTEKPLTSRSNVRPWIPHEAAGAEQKVHTPGTPDKAVVAEPEARTSQTWTYHDKLTPWTWTDHYAAVTEPEAPTRV